MSGVNVLFILSDQHNAKCLGHKGHPNVQTPYLDALAEQGVRFDNAVSQNTICTPSRVSWLSGQYCHNHGYYGLSGPRPHGLPTVLGHFRRHGYKTAAIGKIHCPEYWVEDDCDLFLETCGCSVGGRCVEYETYLEERGLTELEDHGAWQEFGKRGKQSVDGRPSKVSYRDGQEGWSVDQSRKFMAKCQENDEPFFLHVSLPKPHQCYTPAQEFWDLYNADDLVLPPNADYDMDGKAPHLKATAKEWREGKWQLLEPKTFKDGRLRKLQGYLGNISHVDHAVGELTAFLDETGLAKNTIVIYSADHGDYACEHGIMEKAPGICSDAITRIPYIWRWPEKIATGHVAEELVETVDMVSTVTSLAGLPALGTGDGKDISHLLQGKSGAVRDVAVTEFAWSKSLRKSNWRLVYYPREMFADEYPDGFGELYNVADDPWEMRNLYFDPEWQDKVKELERELTDWLVQTTRPATILPWVNFNDEQTITRYMNTTYSDGKISPERVRHTAQNYGCNYL
jgi:choline-sulfatase/uncharacterized sulfatase